MMIRRKLATAVAVAGATTLLLTGCGRSDDGPAASEVFELSEGPASGTLTIWAQGLNGDYLKDFVAPFEEENPDVTIEITSIPWDSAQNKYQTAIAGGVTPDVGMLGTDWMSMFLDGLQPVPDAVDTSAIFDASTATAEFDGAAYAVPWYADTRVVFYRTDLAEAAGIAEAPADWDDFRALAEAYQAGGAEYGLQIAGSGWNSFFSNLPFVWSNGGEVISADQDAWQLDSPEVAETVAYLEAFWADGLADRNPSTDQGAGIAKFVDGSAPMFVGGPFNLNDIRLAAGEEFFEQFALAPIPAGPNGQSTSVAGGGNLAVFKDAENPDAAWKLIDWLSQPEVQTAWYETIGDLPANADSWSDAVLADDAKVSVFGEQLLSTATPPTVTTWAEVSAAADSRLELISRGEESVDDGLAALQSTADSLGFGR